MEFDVESREGDLAALRRWEGSGAVWRVLARGGDQVTVGLFSCDGGEEMGRIVSSDPALRAYVTRSGRSGCTALEE